MVREIRWSGSRSARRAVALAVAIGLVATGAFLSNASSDGNGPQHARVGETAVAGASLVTGTSTVICRFGYDVEVDTLVPPDDSTTDNPPAASTSFAKPCPGVVVAQLSSEMAMPTAADFIHLDMRATCLSPMTFVNPCTVGQTFFGTPAHAFAQNGPSTLGTRTVTMAFPALKRGRWKFEVLPGGNGVARMQSRTFTATAYNGG
jgi:hypothetical protein